MEQPLNDNVLEKIALLADNTISIGGIHFYSMRMGMELGELVVKLAAILGTDNLRLILANAGTYVDEAEAKLSSYHEAFLTTYNTKVSIDSLGDAAQA